MKVLIGISGGIAAYKVADLVRLFVKNGHDVKTILTDNAKNFVTALTLETVSKNKSYCEMFSNVKEVEHVSLAKWADIMIIAPATANTIAKIRNGICDDLLSTVTIAFNKPCYIFPSMNKEMYAHQSVQENINKLRDWGYRVYEPEEGELACGDSGKGRMPDLNFIYEIIVAEEERSRGSSILTNKVFTITAGYTKAYLDPVRYIANSASGRMGVELARQAWLKGAKVNLICNKEVLLNFPWISYYVESIKIAETTDEVLKSAMTIFNETDVYISSAALCDFSNEPSKNKIKSSDSDTNITLKPSVDVFKQLSLRKKGQLMVGFALETNDLEKNAIFKLKSKGMDMIVANTPDSIGSEKSSVVIIDSAGVRKSTKDESKRVISSLIIEEVESLISKHGRTDNYLNNKKVRSEKESVRL